MRGIGRFLVMDRPQPAMADATGSAHSPQPGAVLAAQGPVGIPGIAGRSFLHRHPRWLFSIAAPPAHRRKKKQRMCVCFSGLTGQMAQAEGLAPSSRGFGDRCFTLSYAYKKCPVSQPGWGLIHSHAADTPRRPHAAKRNRNGQLRICPPQTQKPQGGFPFLTAFDDSIIAWNFGFCGSLLYFPLYKLCKRKALNKILSFFFKRHYEILFA